MNIKTHTMSNTKEDKLRKAYNQYDLQQEVVSKANINIVTCGNCGTVLLHRLELEEVECDICDFVSDPADFPDYNCIPNQ